MSNENKYWGTQVGSCVQEQSMTKKATHYMIGSCKVIISSNEAVVQIGGLGFEKSNEKKQCARKF